MSALTVEILRVLSRAEDQDGHGAGIYLTKPDTTRLLAEMGLECPGEPVIVGTFNNVPIYLNRDVSMVICHDRNCEAYLTFL